jgi:hypothetical protein
MSLQGCLEGQVLHPLDCLLEELTDDAVTWISPLFDSATGSSLFFPCSVIDEWKILPLPDGDDGNRRQPVGFRVQFALPNRAEFEENASVPVYGDRHVLFLFLTRSLVSGQDALVDRD